MNTAGLIILMLVAGQEPYRVNIGSKAFTESAILGEMAALLAEHHGYQTRHVKELGTRNLWDTLRTGETDMYAEYTGTIREEIFAGESLPDNESMRRRLAENGILMTEPLGFNNTYALGMKQEVAQRLGVTKVSDLKKHPELRIGFSNEFMDRADGWPSLRARYHLPQGQVRGMEHALAYRAVDAGDVALTDVYSTDPNIRLYGLRVLEDDLGHFPRYHAVFLYRHELADRAPELLRSLERLEGQIDDQQMLSLNELVELQHQSERRVAADFLAKTLDVQVEVQVAGMAHRIWNTTREHLFLVATSLFAAIVVAVPLGVIAAKKPVAGQFIVGLSEIVQTIPGLALLVLVGFALFCTNLPTIGALPVIIALFMYSLLPVIRNTMTGLKDVPISLKESAEALGLTPWAQLRLVELPMASRMILAGIKTTAVINVGYAALGGLIGAGGYGQPIMTGLRLNSQSLMMEGAIPAAILALGVKWLFEYSERFLVPQGLRLKATN